MGFNAEVSCKALEKQMRAVEKKLEGYDKQFRQVDYGALVKKLEALDKAVGLLAASLKDPQKFRKLAGDQLLDKDSGAKLAQAISDRKYELEKKETDKKIELQQKEMEKMIEKLNIDGRFKVLEDQLKAALAMASSR